MNFLINLDMITFHAISGPIHIIDAITGWDLHHKIISTHNKVKEIQTSVANHLDSIQASTSGLTKKVRKKAIMFIKRLRNTFKSFKETEAVWRGNIMNTITHYIDKTILKQDDKKSVEKEEIPHRWPGNDYY